MKRISGIISSIIILLLLSSGIFKDIVYFFLWLFALEHMQPDVSIAGAIIIRALTILVSYGLIGVIFNAIGLFDSRLMKLSYFIVSTLLGFVIAYIIWTIEQYWIVICIVLGILLLLIIVYYLLDRFLFSKKESKKDCESNE